MYTLLIDTHSDIIRIVFYKDGKVILIKEQEATRNHSITTMPILTNACCELNIDVKDLKQIIVCKGPGSFTGIRIGITIAKTLSYTLNIPIYTITSLEMICASFSHDEVEIIEKEKNGIFIGTFDKDNHLLGDYSYIKTNEYQNNENIKLDYESIYKFATSKQPENPHLVKPLYVKVIEVHA